MEPTLTRDSERSAFASNEGIVELKLIEATRYFWPSSILKVTMKPFTEGSYSIRAVYVAGREEGQPIRHAGLDDIAQAIARERMIADEVDRLHAGLLAFPDHEDQVDAIVRLLDVFRRHRHVVTAGVTVDFDDALGVGLHHGPRQRTARFGLHLGAELLVLDLLVALKRDAAKHGVFDHHDHETAAAVFDSDVGEQAGVDERLEAVIDRRVVEAAAWARLEVGTDRIGFDTAVPLAPNGRNRLGIGRSYADTDGRPRRGRRSAQHQGSGH